jgi:hypothetical protein
MWLIGEPQEVIAGLVGKSGIFFHVFDEAVVLPFHHPLYILVGGPLGGQLACRLGRSDAQVLGLVSLPGLLHGMLVGLGIAFETWIGVEVIDGRLIAPFG